MINYNSAEEEFIAGYLLGCSGNKGDISPEPIDADEEIWNALPEPADNQAVFLFRGDINALQGYIMTESMNYAPDITAEITIDWGDGTIENFSLITEREKEDYEQTGWRNYSKSYYHDYKIVKDYIVTVTLSNTDYLNFAYTGVGNSSYAFISCIMAKYGKQLHRNRYGDGTFSNNNYQMLKYLKISCDSNIVDGMFKYKYCLRKIEYDNKLTEIPNNCFEECYCLKVDNWDFSKVTSVGSYAFERCNNLREIILPKCTIVKSYAFSSLGNLRRVELPECIELEENSFYHCEGLEIVKLPKCQIIGRGAFTIGISCNKLLELSLPECIHIQSGAFSFNYLLRKIIAPKCKQIDGSAFRECYSLSYVEFAEDCQYGSNVFDKCYSLYNRPDNSMPFE